MNKPNLTPSDRARFDAAKADIVAANAALAAINAQIAAAEAHIATLHMAMGNEYRRLDHANGVIAAMRLPLDLRQQLVAGTLTPGDITSLIRRRLAERATYHHPWRLNSKGKTVVALCCEWAQQATSEAQAAGAPRTGEHHD